MNDDPKRPMLTLLTEGTPAVWRMMLDLPLLFPPVSFL